MFDYGVIGYGSQGKRICKLLSPKKKIIIFTKKNKIKKFNTTQNIHHLKKCKYIFICSPNSTHYGYLTNKIFEKSYIFCEKPPVIKKAHLNKLKKKNLKKIYFNFNYRFSEINEAVKISKKYNLGKLIYGNILMGHGLATKKEYKNSWRQKESSVYEILGPHIIDLINLNFDIKNITKMGNNKTNTYFSLFTKEGSKVDVFISYISPFVQEFNFIFENGTLKISDNTIKIRGPRDTFDKNGFFKTPKILLNKKYHQKKDYNLSLKKSLDYFIKVGKEKSFFIKKLTNNSILTNAFFLEGLKNDN